MEKLLYLFLPSFLMIKKFINKDDSYFDIIVKFSRVCLIVNFISLLIVMFVFKNKFLSNDILFVIKYIILSSVVSLFVLAIYKAFKNKINIEEALEFIEEENKKEQK